MALSSGPNLGILVDGLIGEQHFSELMRQWRGLDALVMPHVKSATVTAQPASPTNGDTYIIPTGATGAGWSANIGKLARYSSAITAWEYYTPKKGWWTYVEDTNSEYIHDGTNFKFNRGGGTTAQRPTANIAVGANYFDTTLGKPIWRTASAWVDATGATV